MKTASTPMSRQRGLTMIELLITVSIIAILGAIAFPAYERQTMKAKRADGIAFLMEIASKQERYIVDNGSYATSLSALGYSGSTSDKGVYDVSVATANNDQQFTLTATPQGAQANDECGALILDNLGNHTWENAAATKCW